ncbi:putative RNA ligase/tail attachment protein [Pseudomonas phage vB_PaeM_B55]|uniref:RNA ligase/tail attachment protein n=1 Tax=Pseudomonas phage vB_PaeM_B55 TaxID=3022057 RepID=A0AAE9WKT9_9CAUD|nr:putative RNA ligase/tail attachment protein [Pseudomonas phage vB_PaeM_B55]WBY51902.1 putative RNA ligase/tail attachment protein [Pseudomonas phage vB_PaeM_B55]
MEGKLHIEMYKDLIDKKLVTVKHFNGMSVIKYARKVFYDNLWNKHPLLLEARGHVFDQHSGDCIVRPFEKVFNLGENGAGRFLHPKFRVRLIEKVNGFMFSVTKHNGSLIFSTTGSLSSDYVALGRKYVSENADDYIAGFTYNFEICSPEDPHIVEEEEGAYLIGVRDIFTGQQQSEHILDAYALGMSAGSSVRVLRPDHIECSWAHAKGLLSSCEKEGYMVRTGMGTVKCKSTHYLGKKFIMRMGSKKVNAMYQDPAGFKQTLDEEFYPLVDFLVNEVEESCFVEMTDAQRRLLIETYFDMTRI